MKPIDPRTRTHLLGLTERLEDAKEDLKIAIEGAAASHGVDKAVLRKVVAAWHKQKTEDLQETAQQTMDLLDSQPETIQRHNMTLMSEPEPEQA